MRHILFSSAFLLIASLSCMDPNKIANEEGQTINGKKEGTWIGLYPSKDTAYIGNYRAGLKHGAWIFNSTGGRLYYTATYKNDKLHGVYTHYFNNGNKNYETPYIDGIDSGTMKVWHRNGAIKQIGKKYSGRLVGEWLEYDELGNITQKSNY